MDIDDLLHSHGKLIIEDEANSFEFYYNMELDETRKQFLLTFDSQEKISAFMLVLAMSHMLNNMKAAMNMPDSDLSDILLRLRSEKGIH